MVKVSSIKILLFFPVVIMLIVWVHHTPLDHLAVVASITVALENCAKMRVHGPIFGRIAVNFTKHCQIGFVIVTRNRVWNVNNFVALRVNVATKSTEYNSVKNLWVAVTDLNVSNLFSCFMPSWIKREKYFQILN